MNLFCCITFCGTSVIYKTNLQTPNIFFKNARVNKSITEKNLDQQKTRKWKNAITRLRRAPPRPSHPGLSSTSHLLPSCPPPARRRVAAVATGAPGALPSLTCSLPPSTRQLQPRAPPRPPPPPARPPPGSAPCRRRGHGRPWSPPLPHLLPPAMDPISPTPRTPWTPPHLHSPPPRLPRFGESFSRAPPSPWQ